ncbi:MAG: ribonuclease R [Desulfobulbaceae bacterium]|jgi:ribonuclease R|nr:ribonuclease R [Desulfobulbaceae bacterium]
MSRRPTKKRFKKKRSEHSHQRKSGNNVSRKKVDLDADQVVMAIMGRDGKATSKDIWADLNWPRSARKDFSILLKKMLSQNVLVDAGEDCYTVNPQDFMQGELTVNPKGFGFVKLHAKPGAVLEPDVFVPGRFLGSAMHGDHVLIQRTALKQGRTEGRIVMVVKRGLERIVGILDGNRVRPDDSRIRIDVVVEGDLLGAKDGEAVLVSLGEYSPEDRQVAGTVVEVLGDPDSGKVQMQMVMRTYNLAHEFSQDVLDQVAGVSDKVEVTEGREDLRDVFHVTIDGITARDFDDAVCVEETEKGYRLYVSIADVGHYVESGSPLDREAYERGTSVYFPAGVIPMLPERLSNGLCSLNPDEDRYAFSAILDFDATGKRIHSRFCRGVIRSRHRLTYEYVWGMLSDTLEPDEFIAELAEPVARMAKLGRLLTKRRFGRGAIGFEMPEVEIVIGEDDQVSSLERRERTDAHKLIEEFMLAANEAVAEHLSSKDVGILYRIHETPDPLKVADFAEFASNFLSPMPKEPSISPQWFNKILDLARDTPREFVVNNLLLRTMKQARYSPENAGHFGLAADFYAHFTSPIRRYPDLQVHRALAGWLSGKKQSAKEKGHLVEMGEFLSTRERVAVDAERDISNRLKARYLVQHIGTSFPGIISGVTSWGMFVELDMLVSGVVAIDDLEDDTYFFEEKMHRLVGRRTGKHHKLGDIVVVRVAHVDLTTYRVNFVLDEDGLE